MTFPGAAPCVIVILTALSWFVACDSGGAAPPEEVTTITQAGSRADVATSSAEPDADSGGAAQIKRNQDMAKKKKDPPPEEVANTTGVVLNGVDLSKEELSRFRKKTRAGKIPPGRYWYDRSCGAYGREGGPTVGFTRAGIRIGGKLKRDASRGKTRVYVNGRRLPRKDLRALESLTGRIVPGRYYIRRDGSAGFVGQPPMVNLIALARRARRASSGGGGTYCSKHGFGCITSDGNGFIGYNSKDSSVSIGR